MTSRSGGAVRAMRAMERRLVHTPVSRAREILQRYGVPDDVLMWEGADPEAPGPKKVQQMLKEMQLEGLREKVLQKVIHVWR